MSYGKWEGDHEAVRKFARAVATSIYHARLSEQNMKKEERGKAWYDEVVMLRSAPTAKAFFERAMILLEQGKRVNPFIASASNSEDFDPVLLMSSIGNSRPSFETFRDLFRMYLILESVPKSRKAEAKIGDEDGLDTTLLDEFEDDKKGDEK